MPGEVISREAIDYLLTIQNSGGIITGCADQTLNTVQVTVS